ncbi:ADL096Wp [Eremothecium gossypii ATCC 10895]|uniref:ADL096Wp n=1 Tax=Eremothecium gossypii (strain ATCC 10895 / CBS 109.51 / FGSC 9923 / NRRL Y-1056) TaxID=284811 RepID=Q75AL9_EREGS|nr:ADL096Wp [Eremothecium gossypii ATCC 10895]AAS51824.1 ADL096Wp [Eremothecium gossypii ATCC 10895]AEY96121.1 FADL096Wp [Eremothecium gossypii FDAG1]
MRHVFPFSARYNALLATVYLSLIPCALAYLIPGLRASGRNRSSLFLPLMVSFAFGGLMGDVFLCLLPEVFHSHELDGVERIMEMMRRPDERVASGLIRMAHEHTPNMALGMAVFAGFFLFLAVDKTLRIVGGDDASLHSHSHAHAHSHNDVSSHAQHGIGAACTPSNVFLEEAEQTLKKRNKSDILLESESSAEQTSAPGMPASAATGAPVSQSLRTSIYLNLASGFIHNLTDGVAIATAFYTSKSVGVTTTIAVLMHEIPHELGDLALSLSSGMSFSYAMKSQLLTSFGALLGTAAGCLLNEFAHQEPKSFIPEIGLLTNTYSRNTWGLSIPPQDLILPLTAGGFLYIGTVGVVPELLHTTYPDNPSKELMKTMLQVVAIFAGFSLMSVMA